MRRRLVNIASVVCLVLCVALMGMWVRSYTWSDHLSGYFTKTQVFYVVLEGGRTLWRYESNPPSEAKPDWAWFTRSYPIGSFEIPGGHGGWSTRFGFVIKSQPNWKLQTISSLVLPYWFLVLTSGSLAMAFRMQWPPRFTVGSLFIATTFLATVLGMMGRLDWAWIGQ
jgi:hypothetical protein